MPAGAPSDSSGPEVGRVFTAGVDRLAMGNDRLSAVLLGVAVGLLVGAAVVAVAAGWFIPAERTQSPTGSMTTATGCRPNPTAGGWVGYVPVGDRAVVVFNYTLVHDVPEIEVRADLANPAGGRHVYAIETTPVTDGRKGPPPEDCQPRTTLEAAVTLPRAFGTLEVTLDGRTVATVASGEGPDFRPVR